MASRTEFAARILPACLFAGVVTGIVILSLLPGKGVVNDGYTDKIEHFIAYATAGLMGMPGMRGRHFWSLFWGLVALGGFLEVAQAFVPGRTPSWLDLAADAVGAAFGIYVWTAARVRLGQDRERG